MDPMQDGCDKNNGAQLRFPYKWNPHEFQWELARLVWCQTPLVSQTCVNNYGELAHSSFRVSSALRLPQALAMDFRENSVWGVKEGYKKSFGEGESCVLWSRILCEKRMGNTHTVTLLIFSNLWLQALLSVSANRCRFSQHICSDDQQA